MSEHGGFPRVAAAAAAGGRVPYRDEDKAVMLAKGVLVLSPHVADALVELGLDRHFPPAEYDVIVEGMRNYEVFEWTPGGWRHRPLQRLRAESLRHACALLRGSSSARLKPVPTDDLESFLKRYPETQDGEH